MARDPPRRRSTTARLDFADAARDNSDGIESAEGGQLGWIGKGQLDEEREAAIFAAPIGKASDALVVDGDGSYLFLVDKEETREPDAEQKSALENSAFGDWYADQKADRRDHPRRRATPAA